MISTSIAHFTGTVITGISESRPATRTATTITSDLPRLSSIIVADTVGGTTEEGVGTAAAISEDVATIETRWV